MLFNSSDFLYGLNKKFKKIQRNKFASKLKASKKLISVRK